MKMFSAKTLWDARRIISSAHIPYDDLFDWIYENLPLVLDDPVERYAGMEALARADLYESRAKRSSYRLLKYMFNEMTGGVALSRLPRGLDLILGLDDAQALPELPEELPDDGHPQPYYPPCLPGRQPLHQGPSREVDGYLPHHRLQLISSPTKPLHHCGLSTQGRVA
jgi:hypothetical protein